MRKHLISNVCVLLSVTAVMVHVSHAYKNMGMARERISLILELMAMFLSVQMTFSLVTAAVVWAILDSTSGLNPQSPAIGADALLPGHNGGVHCSSFSRTFGGVHCSYLSRTCLVVYIAVTSVERLAVYTAVTSVERLAVYIAVTSEELLAVNIAVTSVEHVGWCTLQLPQ